MLWKCCVLGLALLASSLAIADEPSVIKPDEAKSHVDKEVIVEYTVMSARVIDDKNICFLNSARNNRDEDNFTGFVTPKGMTAFKEMNIANPGAEFIDKKIRVKGKVVMHKGKPEIKIENADQVELVKSE